MAKYYLTTPLYYVNAKPHIGHSYTEIAADVLARYYRQKLGRDSVHFLTGTDEHGQKIFRSAQAAGLEPQAFTDQISLTFRQLWKTLNIDYDDFIRTTEPRHRLGVAAAWQKMQAAGLIYRSTYDGHYCVSCETFIVGDLGAAGGCPDCGKPVEKMKEDTYFFKTSAFQDRLIKDIESGAFRILPETRRNEVLGFLKNEKLTDLSVTRPKARLSWGIPVPFDPDHVTYVWLDALVNYISAVGYGDPAGDAQFRKWWPADIHIIGKDIIKHHCVLWPAFLYALELPLPKLVFAHGWWVQGGAKMSKSLGNVTDPVSLVERYGVDAYRYFLLRETPFGQDGSFSEDALILRTNTDLANDLGNLLHRTLTMCEKYFDGRVPDVPIKNGVGALMNDDADPAAALLASAQALGDSVDAHMKDVRFDLALTAIWDVISAANRFIEFSAPWSLAKEKKIQELSEVMACLHRSLGCVARALEPFMPETAAKMIAQLGSGTVAKGAPLFPRIETDPQKTKEAPHGRKT